MPASAEQRALADDRARKALALRLAGTDFPTIAAQVGYASRGAAHRAVDRAMRVAAAEQARDAELHRQLELERLDRLQRGLWAAAVGGGVKEAEAVLRIIDRRCKLLGLDAPLRHEVLTMGAIEAEIARLAAQIGEQGDGAGVGVVPSGDGAGGSVDGPEAGAAA